MVVSATWLSDIGDEPYNLRGVSIVLALAAFLKSTSTSSLHLTSPSNMFQITPCGRRTSYLLLGTDILMGCKHGSLLIMALYRQVCASPLALSSSNVWAPDLATDLLEHTSGVIWNALNIDYPGHSFSHLGVFFGWLTPPPVICTTEDTRRGPQRSTP